MKLYFVWSNEIKRRKNGDPSPPGGGREEKPFPECGEEKKKKLVDNPSLENKNLASIAKTQRKKKTTYHAKRGGSIS